MAVPIPRKYVAITFAVLLACLAAAALMSCTSESSTLGQYRQGRTLHFSVVSVERTSELRYATCDVLEGSTPPVCDPVGEERQWSISPSAPGLELVLVRAKVENHTAVSAIINVGREAAELRDFANATFSRCQSPRPRGKTFAEQKRRSSGSTRVTASMVRAPS